MGAYALAPVFWRHYEHHPCMERAPRTVETRDGRPGDPLNAALVGSEQQVVQAMITAGWTPADPVTLRSGVLITEAVLLSRPYSDAPISSLYLWGRKQDLAFERSAGRSPRQRHHVRFWRSVELGVAGIPTWVGAASYDRSVGIGHATGEITHHIAPDVDAERDKLMSDLLDHKQLIRVYQVTGIGPTLQGRNGEHDWYYTDGEMSVGVLSPDNAPVAGEPARLSNALPVDLKNGLWVWMRKLLGSFENGKGVL